MFCSKCGSKCNEDAVFCYKCGNELVVKKEDIDISNLSEKTTDSRIVNEDKKAAYTNSEFTNADKSTTGHHSDAEMLEKLDGFISKLRKNKLLIIIGSSIILLSVMICAFIFGAEQAGGKTPEAVAEKYVEAALGLSPEELVDCFADFYIEHMGKRAYGIENPTRKNIIKHLKNELKENPEEKQDYEITDVYVAEYEDSKDVIVDYLGDNASYYGMSKKDVRTVSAIAEVEVEYLSEDDYNTFELTCIEFDGRWYVLDID